MKHPILIHPNAQKDIDSAYHWYEERREGLGDDFLLCIEKSTEKIRRSPH